MFRLFVAIVLCTFSISSLAETQKFEFVLVDGHYIVRQNPLHTFNSTATPAIPATVVPQVETGSMIQGVGDTLYPEAIKTLTYWYEGTRAAKVKADAESKARVALLSGSSKYAIIPVTADKEADITAEPRVNEYTIGNVTTALDKATLMPKVFGAMQDQLIEDSLENSPTQKFLRYVVLAEKMDDGTITTRNLNKRDQEEYLASENKRIEEDSARRADKIEADRKRAEEDQAALSEQKRKEQQADYDKQQAQRKKEEDDARAKEQQAKENREAIEKRAQERDEACSNGRTLSCQIIDDKFTNDLEMSEKFNNTALCVQGQDHPPTKGPCAPGAPICIYCNTGAQLDRQQRFESFLAVQSAVRLNLASKGVTKTQDVNSALDKFMSKYENRQNFGIHEFSVK